MRSTSKAAAFDSQVAKVEEAVTRGECLKILIVVGGGVIGVEYTSMFATLGVRVILIENVPGCWSLLIRR